MKEQRLQYQTSRKVYKDVKKYDHNQFDTFCYKVYTEGYKDGYEKGAESVKGVEYDVVVETIGKARGVGPATKANIMALLEEKFKGGGDTDDGKDCETGRESFSGVL